MTSPVTIRRLMASDVITLDRDETLSKAEELMHTYRIRHLPIVDGDGKLCGLLTHRDLLRALRSELSDPSPQLNTTLKEVARVREIMTTDLFKVSPDTSALEAAILMQERKLGCLLVVDGDKLEGIITEGDFLMLVITALRKQHTAA